MTNAQTRLKLQTDAEIMRVASSDARDYGASCHEEALVPQLLELFFCMIGNGITILIRDHVKRFFVSPVLEDSDNVLQGLIRNHLPSHSFV